ncbi:MAG: hypothetical protein RMJ56_16885 [Gemmataceae bacterium]|nr:hypothetical protein [Gemmata sp.]MDW8199275.1 hypothetical protein [Gemmataceae bacterium]
MNSPDVRTCSLRSVVWLGVFSGCLLAFGSAAADVPSGPKESQKAPALKVFAVSGDPKDKEVDFVALRQEKPTVFAFLAAKDFDRPMFRYLKKLEEELGQDGLLVAIWLTDDADQAKEYLGKIAQYFNTSALTVYGKASGPDEWGINSDARLTAVVVHQGRVVKSFGYQSLNETDAPAVAETLKKAVQK